LIPGKAVDVQPGLAAGGIYIDTVLCPAGLSLENLPAQLLVLYIRIHDTGNGKGISAGKLKIPGIVAWHCHYGPGSVAHQNIIGHPDRDLLFVDRIDGIASGKNTVFFTRKVRPVNLRFQSCLRYISIHLLLLPG